MGVAWMDELLPKLMLGILTAAVILKYLIEFGFLRVNDKRAEPALTRADIDALRIEIRRLADAKELSNASLNKLIERLQHDGELQRETLTIVRQFPGIVSGLIARQPSLDDLRNIAARIDNLAISIAAVRAKG